MFSRYLSPPVTNARARGGANYAAEGLRREPPRRLLKKTGALPRKSSWRGRALEGLFFCSVIFRAREERGNREPHKWRKHDTFAPPEAEAGGRLEPQRVFLLKPRSLEDSPLPSGALRRGWGYLRATSARPRLSRPQSRPRRENGRRLEPKRVFLFKAALAGGSFPCILRRVMRRRCPELEFWTPPSRHPSYCRRSDAQKHGRADVHVHESTAGAMSTFTKARQGRGPCS